MSKSILEIDTPDACIDCPCHFADEEMVWCGKEKKELLADDISAYRPGWCPLKEVPKKKHRDLPDCRLKMYDDVFNECIDEILKERAQEPQAGGEERCGIARTVTAVLASRK